MSTGNKLLLTGGLGLFAAIVLLTPPLDALAWIVGIIGAGVVVLGLGLCSNGRERVNLLRLFGVAFVVRAVFTLGLYRLGLTDGGGFGGGDEKMWELMWIRSRAWDAPGRYPNSLLAVLQDMQQHRNLGYHYLAGLFFHATDAPSQIALSFINVVVGALTVVLIYASARNFWSERAASFAGWIACFAPSYLFWSAMSQKEAWVLFSVAFTLWATTRLLRDFHFFNALLILLGVLFSGAFRYYLMPFLTLAAMLSAVAFRAQRPARTLVILMSGGTVLLAILMAAHVVRLDLVGFAQSRLEEARGFGTSMAHGAGGPNGRSGIVLDFDIKTPSGIAKTLGVGGIYVLFSPFPWQMSGRQFAVLPELLAWWSLLAFFIAPGMVYAWRENRRALLCALLFLCPLILLYSIGFGNVFLTYRMRSQMLPFYLLLAAGGYERLLQRRAMRETDPQTRARNAAIQRLRAALPASGLPR